MSSALGKRVFKRYSESFKQKVVHEIESGALTIHQAQKRYQIGSHGTITNWLKQRGKTDLLAQRVRTGFVRIICLRASEDSRTLSGEME